MELKNNYKICDFDMCCGCGACIDVCLNGAISLKTDKINNNKAIINHSLCVKCGRCQKTCPQNNINLLRTTRKCFAAICLDDKNKLDSSSGGVGNIAYKMFLNKKKNAIVYGVIFDKQMNALFKGTTDIDFIHFFQGSKYVQANSQGVFSNIKDRIKEGKNVLFVGTPCQVVALRSYLNVNNISDKNLLTIDLLCHGVSPQQYLSENLADIIKYSKIDKIEKISFRSNRQFRNFHLYIEGFDSKGKKRFYNRYSGEDPYFYGFLEGISLRENCYSCQFATENRGGDLTIGDFIGLGSQPSSPEWKGSSYNYSMVLCNTEKGEIFLQELRPYLRMTERPFTEAKEGGISLNKPYDRSDMRDDFVARYPKLGFGAAIYSVAGKEMHVYSCKVRAKRFCLSLIAQLKDRLSDNVLRRS